MSKLIFVFIFISLLLISCGEDDKGDSILNFNCGDDKGDDVMHGKPGYQGLGDYDFDLFGRLSQVGYAHLAHPGLAQLGQEVLELLSLPGEPFFYQIPTEATSIAAASAVGTAGVESSLRVNITDGDFVWTHIGFRPSGGAAMALRIRIRDEGAGYDFMPAKTVFNPMVTSDLNPLQLPIPYRFKQGTVVSMAVDNLRTTADTFRAVLMGFRTQPVGVNHKRIKAIPYFIGTDLTSDSTIAISGVRQASDTVGDQIFDVTNLNFTSYRTTDYNAYVAANVLLLIRDQSSGYNLMNPNVRVALEAITSANWWSFKLPRPHRFIPNSAVFYEAENLTGVAIYLWIMLMGIRHLPS